LHQEQDQLASYSKVHTQLQKSKQTFHAPHARSTLSRCSSQAGNNEHLRHFQHTVVALLRVSRIPPTAIARNRTRINTAANRRTVNDGLHHYHNEVDPISGNKTNINKHSTSSGNGIIHTRGYKAAQHFTLSQTFKHRDERSSGDSTSNNIDANNASHDDRVRFQSA
jgi:hypothetical protein